MFIEGSKRKPIVIWRFEDAPEELQALSPHGGDEDWLAILPAHMKGDVPSFTDSGSPFGCCDVSRTFLEDGRCVLIGAHA